MDELAEYVVERVVPALERFAAAFEAWSAAGIEAAEDFANA